MMFIDKHCWHIGWVVQKLIADMNGQTSDKEKTPSDKDVASADVLANNEEDVSNDDKSENEDVDNSSSEEDLPQKQSDYRMFQEIILQASSDTNGRSKRKKKQQASSSVTVGQAKHQAIIPAMINLPNQKKVKVVAAPDAEYEVEYLLGKRFNNIKQRAEYLVKWKNWAHLYNSWVLIDDLFCDELIEKYEAERKYGNENDLAVALISSDLVVRYQQSSYFIVPYGNNVHNKFCIVGPNKNKSLFTCKHVNHVRGSKHVAHQKLVYAAIDRMEDLTVENILVNLNKNIHELGTKDEGEDENAEVKTLSLSTKPISICLENDILKQMDSFSIQTWNNKALKPELVPKHCKCMHHQQENGVEITVHGQYMTEPILVTAKSILYSEKGIVPVKVYMLKCQSEAKECTLHYQGNGDGIFNYNGSILLTYSVLFDFLFSLICAKGSTFSGYASKLELMYQYTAPVISNAHRFLGKKVWINCWTAFQRVLTVKNMQSPCVICNTYPKTLCFDGVSLGFPKKHVNWASVDLIPRKAAAVVNAENTTVKDKRLVVRSVAARKLLATFLENNINAEDFQNLLQLLQAEKSGLFQLLEVIHVFINRT